MANVDSALLHAVLERPRDAAARLALAAALRETEGPRGEFIAVQLKLTEKGLPHATREALRARERELVCRNRATWTENAKGLEVVFRGGYVDEVSCTAADLVPMAERLFAHEPVTRLSITDPGPVLARLAARGAFRRVLLLAIHGDLGDDGAQALAAALRQRTTPLEVLNVASSGISAKGICAIATALGGCKRLTVTDNPIGDDGFTAIAKSKALSCLEALYASVTEASDEGLFALAKGNLSALERLSIARNDDLTAEGLAAVARSKKLKSLRWLEFTDPETGYPRFAARRR